MNFIHIDPINPEAFNSFRTETEIKNDKIITVAVIVGLAAIGVLVYTYIRLIKEDYLIYKKRT